MSSPQDLRASFNTFIQNLPQLAAEKGLEQVYDLYKSNGYDSLTIGDSAQSQVDLLAEGMIHWRNNGFFRLAELYDGVQLERNDDYFLALMNLNTPLRQALLRHDQQLRDELLWQLLTVEGTPENSLTNIDKFMPGTTWQEDLLTATHEGLIPKERLLDACLDALARDFAAYRAGWFSRMYTALTPTAAESAQRQGALVNLLGSSVGATITLAVKQLSAVHRAGLLDADRFIHGCAPALLTTKANALTVLKILESERATGGDGPVTELALTALGHTHPQVQVAAAQLLVRCNAAETLHQHAQSLSPVARQELEEAGLLANTEEETAQHTAGPEEPSYPVPASPAQPVTPFSQQDAYARTLHAMQEAVQGLESELLFHWLMSENRDTSVLKPLTRQAEERIREHRAGHQIAYLILSALEPENSAVQEYEQHLAHEKTPVNQRIREIGERLHQKRPYALLATPTDTHGWVDPTIFMQRLTHNISTGADILEQDFTQAMLRLNQGDQATHQTLINALEEIKRTADAAGRYAPYFARARTKLKDAGKPPHILENIQVSWSCLESDTKRPSGKPEVVWWSPTVHLPKVREEHTPEEKYLLTLHYAVMSCEQLALTCPSSTAPVAVGLLEQWVFFNEEEGHHYRHNMARLLRSHPGTWDSLSAQALAVLANSKHQVDRAGAAELLADTLGDRLSYQDAIAGFAQAAPALMFTRWAHTFEDMAALTPRITLRFLDGLLPHCERTQHGMGKLLGVYAQEYLRVHGAKHSAHKSPQLSPEMTAWLNGFKGSSQAAKHARTILKAADS